LIPLALVAVAAVGALLYLLARANRQIDSLLDRIQAPEVVVQRTILENAPDPEPIPVDMGPWATPPPLKEEDNG